MISTTLRKLKEAEACEDGYKKLRRSLPKGHKPDDPIGIDHILKSNGLNDALWALRTLPEHDSLWRHFGVDCAERISHLMEDERSLNALNVARQFAEGKASQEEWAAARDAARAASWDAAWAAAWDARDAAWAAAWAASWAASWDARDAAWAAERDWQADRLIALCGAERYVPAEEGVAA